MLVRTGTHYVIKCFTSLRYIEKSSGGAKNSAVASGRGKVPGRIDSGSSTILWDFDLVLVLNRPGIV